MSTIDKLTRPEVFELSPYVPGKPASEVKRELGIDRVIKLASNENPLGPSPKAVQVIKEMAHECHIYPDASGFQLKTLLSAKYELPMDQIILGNGSDEIIMLLGQTFISPGDEAVMPCPTFPVYKTSVLLMGGKPVEVPLKEGFLDVEGMISAVTPKTKMLFVCNPNNPTGTMINKEQLDYVMNNVPEHVLVVSDQAYAEYIEDPDYGDALAYLKKGKNVLVLHTFSKIYGLAGLRVGYGLVPKDVADVFNRVRLSFNQNSIGQAAAAAALSDEEHVQLSRKVNREGMAFLRSSFEQLGLETFPSWGNFIMVDTHKDAQAVFSALLRKGVIVRPTTAWGIKTCLRITVGTMDENKILVDSLRQVLSSL